MTEREEYTDLERDILRKLRRYAKERGWILNPDSRQLRTVIKGLARNQLKFGATYCPCRLRTKNPVEDQKIVCPCVYHEGEVAEQGHCHCHLFFRAAPGEEEK